MAEVNASPWVDLAVLAPGQSHYWFFDPPSNVHGWVFQATAYPESGDDGETRVLPPSRVEVTELFIVCKSKGTQKETCDSQVSITVTNCGDRWAPYSLWVASIPNRKIRRGELDAKRFQDQQCPGSPKRILVVHDEFGNIRSAALMPEGPNRRAGLRPQRGESVTGVDSAIHGPEELRRDPRRLSETFRVDTVNATLVPKNR